MIKKLQLNQITLHLVMIIIASVQMDLVFRPCDVFLGYGCSRALILWSLIDVLNCICGFLCNHLILQQPLYHRMNGKIYLPWCVLQSCGYDDLSVFT